MSVDVRERVTERQRANESGREFVRARVNE